MPRAATVGSRELKTRLGFYLNRVRQGDSLIVTDRGEPVAELRPLGRRGSTRDAKIAALETLGVLRRSSGKGLSRLQPVRAKRLASDAVRRDRQERE
jgi:prevent-host-death family protein